MEKTKLVISSTPHLRDASSIKKIMLDVLIALVPTTVASIWFFGFRALLIIVLAVCAAVLSEKLFCIALKRPDTVGDFSAVLTGVLLAFNLPASSPFWLPIVGSFFAIIIVKQLFGGLGQNFVNPALAARAFLLMSYPAEMTDWSRFPLIADTLSAATPLAQLKAGTVASSEMILNGFIGNVGGCIGETSVIALLIGAAYLLFRKVISWHVPVAYLGTVVVLSFIIGRESFFTGNPLAELMFGGLILGAFFMATDYTTSPITTTGKLIMGLGCGLITVVIRVLSGSYPEGVSYSILFMNLFVPLIDKFTKPKSFGEVRKSA